MIISNTKKNNYNYFIVALKHDVCSFSHEMRRNKNNNKKVSTCVSHAVMGIRRRSIKKKMPNQKIMHKSTDILARKKKGEKVPKKKKKGRTGETTEGEKKKMVVNIEAGNQQTTNKKKKSDKKGQKAGERKKKKNKSRKQTQHTGMETTCFSRVLLFIAL